MKTHAVNKLVKGQIYYANIKLHKDHLLRFEFLDRFGIAYYSAVKGCDFFVKHNGFICFNPKIYYPNVPYLEKADA